MTLVLARSPQQEQAFEQLLATSKTLRRRSITTGSRRTKLASASDLSDNDIAALTGWLQSQGLQVNWVAPSRVFIGFTGTAANVGRAFQTELRYYTVQRQAAHVGFFRSHDSRGTGAGHQSIRGLFTIEDRPSHFVTTDAIELARTSPSPAAE